MTNIIENKYIHLSQHSLFTRTFAEILLTLTLLIGGSGSAWAFDDFEIDFRNKATVPEVPSFVTINSATPYSDDHGLRVLDMTVSVDGPVKITFGGCEYAQSNPMVYNGETPLTTASEIDIQAAGCYHNGGVATYIYKGNATNLRIVGGEYTPYIKVETLKPFIGELSFVTGGNANSLISSWSTSTETTSGIAFEADGTTPKIESSFPVVAIKAKYHSADYGLALSSSMSFYVAGPVKISLGMTDYSTNAVISNSNDNEQGEVALKSTGTKYTNGSNVKAEYIYTGEPGYITITGCSYMPYIKVEEAPISKKKVVNAGFNATWNWTTMTPSQLNDDFENTSKWLSSNVEGVKMYVDAKNGRYRQNGSNSVQLTNGTKLLIPVYDIGDKIKVTGYPDHTNYVVHGNTYTNNEEQEISVNETDVKQGYIVVASEIANNDCYLYKIELVHPATGTDPALAVTGPLDKVELYPLALTQTATIHLSGLNLGTPTTNTIALESAVDGMSLSASSATITDGVVNQDITLTYTRPENVAVTEATVNVVVTIDDIVRTIPITYSAMTTKIATTTVDGDRTWTWSDIGKQNIDLHALTGDNNFASKWTCFANLYPWYNENEDFHATDLEFASNYPIYTSNGWVFHGNKIRFTTTVPGRVKISSFTSGSNSTQEITINGTSVGSAVGYTPNTNGVWVDVSAGVVNIEGSGDVRIYEIVFEKKSADVPYTAIWSWYEDKPSDIDTSPQTIQGTTGTINSTVSGIRLMVDATDSKAEVNGNHMYFNSGCKFRVPVKAAGDKISFYFHEYQSTYQYLKAHGTAMTGQNCSYIATAEDAANEYVEFVADGKVVYIHTISVKHKTPFQDFEIDLKTATPELPAGVTQISYPQNTAVFHSVEDPSHGWRWYAIEFDVDGPVEISVGGCQFITDGSTAYLENESGKIADINNKKVGCSGTATYLYEGGAATLRLYCGQYCPSIKVEAVEIPETRTFTDFTIDFSKDWANGTSIAEGTTYYVTATSNGVPTTTTTKPENYLATFKGKYHNSTYGIYGTPTFKIPVDGAVRITYGCNDAGGDVTITNAKGKTIATLNTHDSSGKWDNTNNADRIQSIVYNSKLATTLTLTGGGYVPYIKVEQIEYISSCKVTYYDTDGTTKLGEETVEGGSSLTYAYGVGNGVTIGTGKKFIGWYDAASGGSKVAEGTAVSHDINLYAIATDIETLGNDYTWDMTDSEFDPADHELISTVGGHYHNDHGWIFGSGDKIQVQVDGKVTLGFEVCNYSNSQDITVSDGNGFSQTISHTGSNDESACTEASVSYSGTGTLTITFANTTYIHNVSVEYLTVTDDDIAATAPYDAEVSTAAELLYALGKASGAARYKILLRNGVYNLGTAYDTQVRNKTSLIGESRDGVIIQNHPTTEGIWSSATLKTGSDVVMQNLTLQCVVTEVGGAERGTALYDNGANNSYRNIRLLGRQDTYYSHEPANSYFEDCEIHGTVDFICGYGNAWFEKCNILIENRSSAVIVAPRNSISSPYASNYKGYTFNNCVIDNAEGADMDGKYYLGRGWEGTPKSVFANCSYNISYIGTDGYDRDNWANGGASIKNNVGMTKQDAALTNVSDVMGSSVVSLSAQPAAPTNVKHEGNTLTWTAVAGISKYAVYHSTTLIGIATTNSFTIPESSGAKGMRSKAPASDRYYVASISSDGVMSEMASEYEFKGFVIDLTVSSPVLPDDVTQISYDQKGARHNDTQHGWQWYAVQFAVDGPVDIYVGGCQHIQNLDNVAYLTDGSGTKIADLDNKTAGCNGYAAYHYTGPAGTLKLYCGQYCPAIRVARADKESTEFTASWDWTKKPEALDRTIESTIGWLQSDEPDVDMFVAAASGKLAVNGDNVQFNSGTELYVPVYGLNDKLTVIGYPGSTAFSVHGVSYTTDATNIEVTQADVDRGYISILATDNGYLKTVTLEHRPYVRTFEDFKIDFRSNPYTVVLPDSHTLPANVTVNAGTYHGTQHGTQNATVTVAVDGPVQFTIGGCGYSEYATVSVDGGTPIEIDTKAAGCDNVGVGSTYTKFATYKYNSKSPATLTFNLGAFCPYFFAEACEYSESYNIEYYDTDGTTLIGQEEVASGSPLVYKYDESNVTVAEGKAFRGWRDKKGLKVSEGTPVNADMKLYAKATDIEVTSAGATFNYDFREANFYMEDHELISSVGGVYNDGQHGWKFVADEGFSVQVAGNAKVIVSRCMHSNPSKFTVTTDNGGTVSPNKFNANVTNDGETAIIEYEGPAATLTFTTDGVCYVHNVQVINDGAVSIKFAETKDKAIIYNNDVDATVYYTLDGSTPTTTNYAEMFTGASHEVSVKDSWVKAISVKNGVESSVVEQFCRSTFAGFSWDFSTGSQLLGSQQSDFVTGVIIDDKGEIHLVPGGDRSSSIDIKTQWHDPQHGYLGILATVPVDGPVIVTIGNCKFNEAGAKFTITASNGQSWDLVPAANCYDADRSNNFVRLEYIGGPTVLTIKSEPGKTLYVPYLSVVDANTAKVKFVNKYPKTLRGTVPEETEVNEAHQAFIPYNNTLYREGWTVTGWEDSETGDKYELGRNYTFYQPTTLYPIMTLNEKEVTDTDHPLTVTWPFDQLDGAPVIKLHDSNSDPLTMTYVQGVDVEGSPVDVPLVLDATLGKVDNRDPRVNALGNGTPDSPAEKGGQINNDVVLTIPAVYGMSITLNASNKVEEDRYENSTTHFGSAESDAVIKLREGETVLPDEGIVTNNGKSITFTYNGDSPTISLWVKKASSATPWGFFTNLSVTYPVLPNVVVTNVIANADLENFPHETADKAGDATVELKTAAASHTNTGKRFKVGDVVTLSASAEYGYVFSGFRKRVEEGDPVVISTSADPADFTVPVEGGITTIEAVFTRKNLTKITVTSADPALGMVSLTPKYDRFYNQQENGVIAYYEPTTEVTAHAQATKDYVIDKWVDGSVETPNQNVLTFTASEEKNIVAHFKLGEKGTVIFDITGRGVWDTPDPDTFNSAVSIAPETQTNVRSFYVPNYYTVFNNQHTLTHWEDDDHNIYSLGTYGSFSTAGETITLHPVFEHNIAGKENRTRGDELYWDFRTQNLAQSIDIEEHNRNFFWTSKVSVEVIEDGVRRDHTRDVALWIHTNEEGFVRNNDIEDWFAFGPGTTIDLPSCAGATIKMYCFSEITSTTFDGHVPVIDEQATRELREKGEPGYIYTYTTSNPLPRVTIAIGDDYSYYRWIKCYSLPANMMEFHMNVDDDNHGEITDIRGRIENEAKELADGGFAFLQGNRVYAYFKRNYGYDLDRIVDIDRRDDEGNLLPVVLIERGTDGTISGVKMALKESNALEDAVLQPDGSWLGTVFTFTEFPGTDGERDSYELQFEITSHRNMEVRFVERPTYYITYNVGEFATGIAPSAQWVEPGDKFVIPGNNTLYYEGHTLKAWRDADDNLYPIGTEHTAPAHDLRLFPVFYPNTFSPFELTADTKVTWYFTRKDNAPNIVYERSSGILVAQLHKDDDYIDMKIDLNASEWLDDQGNYMMENGNVVAGKFNNTAYNDRCQINEHSIITFPAITGCEIELEALETLPSHVTIAGQVPTPGMTVTHTYEYGCTDHTIFFRDNGDPAATYNTWCSALSITYKPLAASLPELASVTYNGNSITTEQLATLKSAREIEIAFTVGDNDDFPQVVATATNGVTEVTQANLAERNAVIKLYTNGGVIVDDYTIRFKTIVTSPPVLLGSPSIYVNTTGYNASVPPLEQPVNGTISIAFNRTMEAIPASANLRLTKDGVAQGVALVADQDATLVFRYWNLDVDTEYTLTIPAGMLKDVYGGTYNSNITVTFRTAETVIPVEHRRFNWIVGVDGTLLEGINAANNASGLQRFYIFVPDGTYQLEGNEKLLIKNEDLARDPSTLYDEEGTYRSDLIDVEFENAKTSLKRANVSLIGQSETGTQIFNRPVIEGIDYTATLHLKPGATDFYAQDLTLENRFDYRKAMENPLNLAARAVAFQGHADRTIMKNVTMLSYQDTYYASNQETNAEEFCAYFENCSVAGVVDWVCGGGNLWWEKCDIIHRDRAGNNFAAPHANANQKWGMVFNDCVIRPEVDRSSLRYMTDYDWTLARPWGIAPNQSPACTFLNNTVILPPKETGWGVMYGGMVLRFHEYRTKDANGNLLSLANRSLAACAPAAGSDDYILSDAEAATYNVNDVLGFDPTAYTAQREPVTVTGIEDGVLEWAPSLDGMDLCYFIFKKDADGNWKYYANVAEPRLDFNTFGSDIRDGIYMIRTANQRGGLGAPSVEIQYDEVERYDLVVTEVGTTPTMGWSTICLPNDAKVPAGDINVYSAVSIDDNIVTLKRVNYITANHGYVVYAAAGTYTFLGSSHNAMDTPNYGYAHDSYLSGNPTDAKVSASTTNCYTLAYKPAVAGIGFYRYTGSWLNPHRAYLDVEVFKQYNSSSNDENNTLSKAYSNGIRFVFAPDDATDIPLQDLNAIISHHSDVIYDLSGSRVLTPLPGRIYITNGTKVLRK